MSERELPEGWVSYRVEDLYRSFGGGTPNKGTPSYWQGDIPWLSSGDIKTNRIQSASESITQAGLESSSAKICRAGSVLVVVRSGVLKHSLPVAVLEVNAAINQDIKCFDSDDDDLNGWLALALRTAENDILSLNREGTTVQSVKYDTLKSFEIRLPPLPEQHRIVEKVEALLAEVNAARDRLSKVPRILKRFRQSVLSAACSGRLTEEWRERHPQYSGADFVKALWTATGRSTQLGATDFADVEIPSSWGITNLGEIVTVVTSGSRGWAEFYSNEGAIFIRAQDINTDELDLSAIAHVKPPAGSEGLRTRVQQDDLLITITGANVTKTALVKVAVEEAYVSQHVGLVRPVTNSISPWLHLWLVSPHHGRKQLLDSAYGAGKPGLNLTNIREVVTGIPPLAEQTEIVRRVEALFALADAIEQRVAAATKRTEKLPQAVLSKAFRGELVPTEAELARAEGRDYETAEQLLARVKVEREKNGEGTNKRRTRSSGMKIGEPRKLKVIKTGSGE